MEADMNRRVPTRIALAVAAAVAVCPTGAGTLSAQTRVISSDAQARFMAIGISKAVVIEVSRDIKSVVVADRTVASVVALSHRQIEILGAGLGQTNVFLLDEEGRQIDGFDVVVKGNSQQHGLENYPYPANVVQVTEGGGKDGQFVTFPISCTAIKCLDGRKPGAEQPPGTENINIMGNSPTGITLPGK
jgi:hypothetical protein